MHVILQTLNQEQHERCIVHELSAYEKGLDKVVDVQALIIVADRAILSMKMTSVMPSHTRPSANSSNGRLPSLRSYKPPRLQYVRS